jgi:hypothetical protein
MATSVDIMRVRAMLGRQVWAVPTEFGPDGWRLDTIEREDGYPVAVILVTCSDLHDDPTEWVHASMARRGRVPSYDDLCQLHRAVYGAGWAYQVFAPPDEHINIHPFVLHLWGRLDGAAALPNFGIHGTI